MNRKNLLSFMLIIAAAALVSSCGSGRSYYSSPPRPYVSLILSPTPGFTMSTYPDGRYYHRSPQGFIYWKGYDNRFFLDRKYLNNVKYNNREYYEWKRCEQEINKHRNRYRRH